MKTIPENDPVPASKVPRAEGETEDDDASKIERETQVLKIVLIVQLSLKMHFKTLTHRSICILA